MNILGKKKDIVQSIGTSATLTSLGAAAGAAMAIITFLSYMHIDVIPFAWADDVKSIEQNMEKLTQAVTMQSISVLQMQRDRFVEQLHEAEEELKVNPESRTAKKEVDRLKQEIANTDKKISILEK